MIQIILAVLGVGLNLTWFFSPDWVSQFNPNLGSINSLLIVNSILFLGFGFLAVFNIGQANQIKTLQNDIKELNQQTVTLNDQTNEKSRRISDLMQQNHSMTERLRITEEMKVVLEEDLVKARTTQAKVEEELRSKNRVFAESEDTRADLVQFLGLLQKHGRFLDFVMGDIGRFPDDRVGAAARIVHQGCHKAIRDYFDIQPILEGSEGSQIELEDETDMTLSQKVRFIGQREAELPPKKKGRLVHRGWQTLKVDLPKRTRLSSSDRTVIAPAEIELN